MGAKRLLTLGLILLFICPTVAFASALEGPGLGARAISMGGAFIGLADDWTATFWNPAGLAQLKEPGFGVTVDVPTGATVDGNSFNNLTLPEIQADPRNDQQELFFRVVPGEPTKFNIIDRSSTSFLPGMGFHLPVGDYTLGFASYQPLGQTSGASDTIGNVSVNFESSIYMSVFNLSLAKEIIPTLSLGAGINFIHGENEMYVSKSVSPIYTFDSDSKADGNGYEGIFGFLYKPIEQFSIGAVYRTGSQVTLEGNAKVNHTLLPALDNETDFERVVNQPATYGVGMAFNPSANLTLTADWNRTDWGEMRKEITYQQQGGLLANSNHNLDWKETDRFRIGAECKPFSNGLALRLGYYYEPSPVPGKAVSMTNVIEVDKDVVTAGIGYTAKNARIDLTYLYAWGSEIIDNVYYEKVVNSFQFALSFWF